VSWHDLSLAFDNGPNLALPASTHGRLAYAPHSEKTVHQVHQCIKFSMWESAAYKQRRILPRSRVYNGIPYTKIDALDALSPALPLEKRQCIKVDFDALSLHFMHWRLL
jgi:hypothetical protein